MKTGAIHPAIFASILAVALAILPFEAAGLPQADSGAKTGAFATPLTSALIDNAASAEWVDGAERPLANPMALRQLVWTQTAAPQAYHFQFGASNHPGTRYLRLGFTAPVAVASVLVQGGGQLSVLRSQAPYPGNLADNSQWIPAQRLLNHEVSNAPVDQQSYAVWVLPPGTVTRALRFSHTSVPTDSSFAGALGGVYVLSSRMVNLAPQAAVTVSANSNSALLLIDEKNNNLDWDNGLEFSHPVTTANPEWIVLTWPRPVALGGLAALGAGFNAADAQIFLGPDNANPQDAPQSDWIAVGQPYTFRSQYPRPLDPDWMDFGKTVHTRAVRLRITAVTDESHSPQLIGKTRNGNRIWLGELMALSPLQSGNLEAALLPAPADSGLKPPIPVEFTLDAPGYVTLVIDDAQGNRVRNLASNTWFESGRNTVWWDGTDELLRNPDAADHGIYLIPTHYVTPGSYQVHGIYHKAIDLHYEFSVYNAGHPAWETVDTRGGWLTNHTPPSSALFVPADKAPGGKPLVYLGSYISEGGAGLAWVDLDGNKQGGRGWIGGNWTAAPFLACDAGVNANPAIFAYVAAAWGEDQGGPAPFAHAVVRLTGLTSHGDKPILNYTVDIDEKPAPDADGRALWVKQIGGLAVHNNIVVVSLPFRNQLLFADALSGKILGLTPVDSPRGVAFDAHGNLLALSARSLLRYSIPASAGTFHPEQLPAPEPLVASGLEDPTGITSDSTGDIYISDRGNSNQVKVYSPDGKFQRAIGHAGPSHAGPYDPLHMNNPRGLAIDSNNHLWVAEEDFQPKRVSLWTPDGKLLKAFYGPSEYGGGGSLDPRNKNLFYYHGMQFNLDWNTGTDTLDSVFYRPGPDAIPLPRYGDPTTVLYGYGHRYFTNVYMGYPTQGVSIAMLYLDTGGVIRPAAAFGKANDWSVLKTAAFRPLWPKGIDPDSRTPQNSVQFSWSDLNNNGQVDPAEVTFSKATTGSITVMPDLGMIDADVDGKVMRYAPGKVTTAGVPVYEIDKGSIVAEGAQSPSSDGGGQVLYSPQATVMTTAPLPFAPQGLGGIFGPSQSQRWSYPSLWPGLHASHSAPVPDVSGEIIGSTRLLGGFVNPPGARTTPLWAINGNLGVIYLFTSDGMFVAQLFQDMRTGKPWNMPAAPRNLLLNDVSLSTENFFPSIAQTPDGKIYIVDGGHTSIVRVDGLDTLRPIPAVNLQITREQLDKARDYLVRGEAQRQEKTGPKTLEVTLRAGAAPALKDLIASLKSASWATIDRRINQIGWNSKPDEAQAAITIAGGRLYAAFRTSESSLLQNSGGVPNAPFKTGGALDLMIGADPHANPKREFPAPGDLRLLVYQVDGKPRAMLYRAVVPGTRDPVPFSSPSRTITLDQIKDVSNQLELFSGAGPDSGSYAFSIPLDTLGLRPAAGEIIKADIGILRGNGVQTMQRVYWSNKATGITSDVPSEAELTPNLWGEWIFKAAP
jgi:hypothetical protein